MFIGDFQIFFDWNIMIAGKELLLHFISAASSKPPKIELCDCRLTPSICKSKTVQPETVEWPFYRKFNLPWESEIEIFIKKQKETSGYCLQHELVKVLGQENLRTDANEDEVRYLGSEVSEVELIIAQKKLHDRLLLLSIHRSSDLSSNRYWSSVVKGIKNE